MPGPVEASVVDAFTSEPFRGNPAAVVLLPAGGADDDGWMQRVAAEFNLSETAFVRPRDDGSWQLRWFTPATEVALCGHATLAAAHVLLERKLAPDTGEGAPRMTFRTRSGDLGATTDGEGRVVLDFPLRPPTGREPVPGLDAVLGVPHTFVGTTVESDPTEHNALVVVAPGVLLGTPPDLAALAALPLAGLIVSARPDPADAAFDGVDVISRYFAPAVGIPEDPVTGSAHCTLVDHWAAELGRERLRFRQVSARGGDLLVTRSGGRVLLAGHAVTAWDVTLRSR